MLNSILRTSEAVTSTQAVALREVRKVCGRDDGSVVALDGVAVGLARDGETAAPRIRPKFAPCAISLAQAEIVAVGALASVELKGAS